jgi:hypothetical protein
VYESVRKATQSVAARIAGLILALVTARLLGPTAGAVTVIALIAVLAGPRRTADDRLQIASTAVIALTATATDPMGHLFYPVNPWFRSNPYTAFANTPPTEPATMRMFISFSRFRDRCRPLAMPQNETSRWLPGRVRAA